MIGDHGKLNYNGDLRDDFPIGLIHGRDETHRLMMVEDVEYDAAKDRTVVYLTWATPEAMRKHMESVNGSLTN